MAVIEAAERAGVKHLVFSSVLHAIEDRLIQHRSKLAIEQRIIVSKLNWTILQPTNYMLPAWSYPVFKTEVFRLWWSLDRRQSLIVLDDYAEVAAKVILEGARHHAATYELSSGDCLTAYEIADRFASITGRPIRAEEVTADEFIIKHRKPPRHAGAAGRRTDRHLRRLSLRVRGVPRHRRLLLGIRLRGQSERVDLAPGPTSHHG